MNGKMTAAVLYGKEDLKIEKVPIPRVGDGEVLVKVQVALTCGTDLKVYQRGYHARMIVPPALFGHELAGVIEEVGAGVTTFKKGQRVVALNSAPCQMCFYCSKHQENLCEDLLFNNGAYAEYIRVPRRIVEANMLVIPQNVSYEDAAMTEPLACVLRGLHETKVEIGDTVAILGGGPIGLMFVQVARAIGCNVISVVKRDGQVGAARDVLKSETGANQQTGGAQDAAPIFRVRAALAMDNALSRALGRPNREQVVTRRDSLATMLQALELVNGTTLDDVLNRGGRQWIADGDKDAGKVIERAYRMALGRRPSDSEQKTAAGIVGTSATAEGIHDLLWMIVMLPEFQLIE